MEIGKAFMRVSQTPTTPILNNNTSAGCQDLPKGFLMPSLEYPHTIDIIAVIGCLSFNSSIQETDNKAEPSQVFTMRAIVS